MARHLDDQIATALVHPSQQQDVRVGVEAEQALAAAANITSIPTLMAFKDGALVFAQPGALPAAALNELIEAVRALDVEAARKESAAARQ